MKPLALYIHWPYCVSKCPYCDFASRPGGGEGAEAAWAQAIESEMAQGAALTQGRGLSSLYFGGGTPSLLAPETVARLIESAARFWRFLPEAEITLEANPSSSEVEKFRAFRAAGVNRLSLGVQSFDDEALRFLGRAHDAAAARRALEAAARTFERFSFDLITARRGQTLTALERELAEALSFAPRHLSLYQLTIEEGTPFAKRARKETLTVDDDVAASLFARTQEVMEQAGLPAYEISNHAVPGQESRHNLTYWHYEDYLGLGPSAHGRLTMAQGVRVALANERDPRRWLQQVSATGNGVQTREQLTPRDAQTEALLMGLRLVEGIDRARWRAQFGADVTASLVAGALDKLVQRGFISLSESSLRVTKKGQQRLNALLALLIE